MSVTVYGGTVERSQPQKRRNARSSLYFQRWKKPSKSCSSSSLRHCQSGRCKDLSFAPSTPQLGSYDSYRASDSLKGLTEPLHPTARLPAPFPPLPILTVALSSLACSIARTGSQRMTRPLSTSSNSESILAQLKRRNIPSSLPRDIISFLLHYPSQPANPKRNANLLFYQNQHPARPRRSNCEELQDVLRGNWDELEGRHDFVQWFFPIREQGVNWDAQPLELHEIEGIKSDPSAMSRFLESYRIMLAFYGLTLVNPQTGELALQDDLGLTPHAPSLLLFLLTLQSPPHSLLTSPALCRSMDSYWRWCVRDDEDREFVAEVVERVRSGGTWSEEEYREWIRKRTEEKEENGVAETNGAKEENGNEEANGAGEKL
ncbi:opioid growth factor receptor-like protein [Rhodotorula toruloides]|nr:opioid growth factor receptor-like protein [Rhodotorula toruloides]